MKKEQIKIIVVGTYNGKEQHILTIEQLKGMLGEEMANAWLENQFRTEIEAMKLGFAKLKENLKLDEKVEDILREKLNYKSTQMLFGFGK